MGRFDGDVAIVTGAGQGVGRVTAIKFAEEGAKVICVGRTQSKLDAVVAEIGADKAVACCMDAGSEEDWLKLVAFVKETYGEIDYVVNNAAINLGKSILEESLDEFKEEIHCNMIAYFLGNKYGYEILKKGCYSAIVNVSSVASFRTGVVGANAVGYSATKAAINMISKNAAWNYGKDCIRVNTVLPSSVNTALRTIYLQNHPEAAEMTNKTKPLPPHYTEPEDIAEAIFFFCDKTCHTATGAELLIDAGNALY